MSSVRIKAVETIIVDLPLRRTQRFAAIGAKSTAVVLVRIKTSEGVEGIGECCTPSGPWWSGESVESIKMMIDDHIAPNIINQDAFDVRGITRIVDRRLFGNSFAKAGVEMALLDIQGKVSGVPVHDLLGGRQRSALPCSWPLATGNAELEIEEAHRWISERKFNIFKLKMGFLSPQEDVERACKVAQELQGHASVRADPNESWDEATCKWAIPRMADAGVSVIEQPLPRWNHTGSKRLTRASCSAIMVDESACSIQDVLRLGQMHAADIVSIKVMKHGGLSRSRQIADVAVATGMALYMGTFLECSIGTAASMQLCATFDALPFGGELSGPNLVAEDIATKPARYEDFELKLEDGVGLAVQIDEDKVRALRRDRSYTSHPM